MTSSRRLAAFALLAGIVTGGCGDSTPTKADPPVQPAQQPKAPKGMPPGGNKME